MGVEPVKGAVANLEAACAMRIPELDMSVARKTFGPGSQFRIYIHRCLPFSALF